MTAGLSRVDEPGAPQPLAGYRVVDMTEVWAGPFAASLLGDLGAEVVRVESFPRASMTRPVAAPTVQGTRLLAGEPDAPRPWDRSPTYHLANRNKLGLALNAVHPKGREVFLRLIAGTDAFLIGYSAGTAQRMGLDYETLRRVRPDLVMLTMPGWGEAGPYKGYATLGSGLDAFAGHHHLRAYPGEDATSASAAVFHSDATGALAAAFAVMAALYYRERSGKGQHIDMSQAEVLLTHMPRPLLDWQWNRRPAQPAGNADPHAAPHGCYPCRDEHTWVTIAVRDDDQWRRLVEAMGSPAWAADTRFATILGRLEHRGDLDGLLGAWTRGLTPAEVFLALAPRGVPAGPVYDSAEVLADPHLAARAFFPEVGHALLPPFRRPGPMWVLPRTPSAIRKQSNLLGEHNREVLCSILGLGEDEFAALEHEGVVGDAYAAGSDIDQ